MGYLARKKNAGFCLVDGCAALSSSYIFRSKQGIGRRMLVLFFLLLGLGLFPLGCSFPKANVPPGQPILSERDLLQAGSRAWEKKDYLQARTVYLRLISKKDLAGDKLEEVWSRYVYSLFYLGKLPMVKQAREQWSRVQPGVQQSWSWIKLSWLLVCKEQGIKTGDAFLLTRALDQDLPFAVRMQCIQALVRSGLMREEYEQVAEGLAEFYASLRVPAPRLEVENRTRQLLKRLERKKLLAWYGSVPAKISSGQGYDFPWILLAWQYAEAHLLEQGAINWPQAFAQLQDLLSHSRLGLNPVLQEEFKELQNRFGPPTASLVLLLPLDGPYGGLSWKILQGADVAQWGEVGKGILLDIQVVNTNRPGWVDRLAALPENYRLVGGPLLKDSWQQIIDKGLVRSDLKDKKNRRIFFVMCPDLSPAREGEDGFRFFPSKKDQITALLDFVQGTLGSVPLAVLYPKGNFGSGLAELFVKQAQDRGLEVRGLQSYLSQRSKTWQRKVARLLGVPKDFFGANKEDQEKIILSRPEPDFEVVFIPDSFSHVQMLIPEFFFFNENRLVFLGPALWSQEKIEIGQLDRHFFALTAMPGPWAQGMGKSTIRDLQQAMELQVEGEKPGFWVGLGFDFVRLATKMAIALQDINPSSVAQYLSEESAVFPWTIAPLSWDEAGKAREELYMLQPKGHGTGLLDPDRFKARWLKKKSLPRFGQSDGTNSSLLVNIN